MMSREGSGQVRTTRTLLDETHTPVHLYISVTDGLISVQTLLSVDILSTCQSLGNKGVFLNRAQKKLCV